MMLEIINGAFGYRHKDIFSDLSFHVKAGEIVSILGPNGIGKTTLLKCLMGLLPLGRGTIKISGKPLSSYTQKDLARHIAYVPQHFTSGGLSSISVLSTVLMGRMPHISRGYDAADRQKAYGVLCEIGVERHALSQIDELSGGERQLVFIARAILQEASLILFDEPTSNLDMQRQLSVLRKIEQLAHQRNIAILMTMHDINLAGMFSTRILMLQDGQIFGCGAAEEMIREETIRHVYGVDTQVIQVNGYPHVILLKDTLREQE